MSTYKKWRQGLVKTQSNKQLAHELALRYAKIIGVSWPEALDNPLIVALVKNTLDGQIMYIDNVRHKIIGLPSGEQ